MQRGSIAIENVEIPKEENSDPLWSVTRSQSPIIGTAIHDGSHVRKSLRSRYALNAISAAPDDYVVFPAPAGPKGRGYMPVVAGLAIPKGAPDKAGALKVIEHLSMQDVQLLTASRVGFFPTLNVKLPEDLDPGVALLAGAVAATQASKDAVISLLPVGLGDKGGEFNKVYMDSFQRIVLQNEAIPDVLKDEGAIMAKLMTDTKAPCWAPDAKSDGPCPVE